MPGLVTVPTTSRKRRREDGSHTATTKVRKASKTSSSVDDKQAEILQLESQILDGNSHLNNIVTLQTILNDAEKHPKPAILAAVALCRVFCRMVSSERLVNRSHHSDQDAQIVQWLKARMQDYIGSVCMWIGSPDGMQENTAITLLMRIVKEETSQESNRADQAWRSDNATFSTVVRALLQQNDAEGGRQEFVDKYVNEQDDVRYFTQLAIARFAESDPNWSDNVSNAIEMLVRVEGIPETEVTLDRWFGKVPTPANNKLLSAGAHRKAGQECWLCIFRAALTTSHRKKMLSVMTPQILPWFATRMELLTDFLTDSFNAGGALPLLALSGIFQLMTRRNLDYPDFYTKLYSLLDQDLLHSTHRSRFFRLLDKCMSSSHLPAAMVASFIKRLSRLALRAPPGAIVWIVPWSFNMLRSHPSCTFMLHRPFHAAHSIYSAHPNYNDEGMEDPFVASQPDPMLTNALDSSLWELHTLQSHWHPNVATLARILGEQFTKRDYVLDDFLDYSYSALVEAELRKEMKKKPEVEWEIPKRIFTADTNGERGLNEMGLLLEAAVQG